MVSPPLDWQIQALLQNYIGIMVTPDTLISVKLALQSLAVATCGIMANLTVRSTGCDAVEVIPNDLDTALFLAGFEPKEFLRTELGAVRYRPEINERVSISFDRGTKVLQVIYTDLEADNLTD